MNEIGVQTTLGETALDETASAAGYVVDIEETAMTVAAGAYAGVFVPPYAVREKSGFGHGVYLAIKRLFDFVSASLAFIVLSPFILLVLLIKWLEDFHSPIYVSVRIGKNGRPFKIYKIRTMVPNADEVKEQLIAQGLNEADPPAFKMKNDPRVTRFGKFLRRFSIDEILQLLNVMNSTMSVVGPRPPLPSEVESYTPEQMQRLKVKGGLLCLWQIQKNRHDVSFDEWVRLDLEYIERQSLLLDAGIIFKGAYMVVFDHSGE